MINKEPVLSNVPKCVAEGCLYGVIEYSDYSVGLCRKCLGTGVAHFNTRTCRALIMMFKTIMVTLVFRKRKEREI